MPGEGRKPSTANASTRGQRASMAPGNISAGPNEKVTVNKLSPMKSGTKPQMGVERRGEGSQNAYPDAFNKAPFTMLKDSGPKTDREREWNKSYGGAAEQFRTAYELEKAEVAKGDGHTGSQTGFRPKKAQ